MTTTTQDGAEFDARAFRQALGSFPTGVVVVAAVVDGSPVGLAVNSFSSVSLDPPLVSFCADHRSSTWPVLRKADGFTVTILALEQEDECKTFAAKGADRFASIEWTTGPSGHPRLTGGLAWLDCETHEIVPAGDHEIVLGRVVALEQRDGDPLVFHRGRFASLAVEEETGSAPSVEDALAGLEALDLSTPFFGVLAARFQRKS